MRSMNESLDNKQFQRRSISNNEVIVRQIRQDKDLQKHT